MAGAFIERLATALHARGHRLCVVMPADRGSGGRERRDGIELMRVRYAPARWEDLAYRGTMVDRAASVGGKLTAGSLVVALARATRQAARVHAPVIVHAHWWVPGGASARLARLLGGPPYVVTLHGTDIAILERSRLARWLARRVLRTAAGVTAVSSYLAERAAAVARIDVRDVVVQPMPADLGQFSRVSAGGGGVVTVGRLVGQKRIDLVLEAVARLAEQGRRVALTIIGDGPLRSPLEEHAQRLGLAASVRFLGEVEPAALAESIGNADVFAFPARGEGLGLAAAEALLLGVPVVATRGGGGVTDIVPEQGAGRVVAEGSPSEMARAIAELLDDPDARSRAVEAGRRLRARLDPDGVAARFEALYARAAGLAGTADA